jgi:hypothetical protein
MLKKAAALLVCCIFCITAASCSLIAKNFLCSPEPTGTEETTDPGALAGTDEADPFEVETIYTYGYAALLNPNLSDYEGLVSYPVYDSYSCAVYVPVIDGGTFDYDTDYFHALYDSASLYYEVVDGTGYTPAAYMQDYVLYLYDYFDDPDFTEWTLTDIYVTADSSLAAVSAYYCYDGERYYDIMGIASTGTSDFVYFDFIYMESCTSDEMLTLLDTIFGFTGVWY